MKKLIALALTLSVAFGTSAFAAGMASASEFSDVSSGKWYFTYVDSLTKRGLIRGTGDGRFLPDADMTKAQFVTILVNAVIGTQKQDGTHWAERSVQAAYEAGITTPEEMPDTLWDEPILRQEVARLLSRVCEKSQEKPEITSKMLEEIADYEETPDEYKPYIADVFARGIYTGNEKREMMPEKPVTRAECAAIITKLLDTTAQDKFVFDPAVHAYPAGDSVNGYIMKADAAKRYYDALVDELRFYEQDGNLMFEGELPELPDGYVWYCELMVFDKNWKAVPDYLYSFFSPGDDAYAYSNPDWTCFRFPQNGQFHYRLADKSFIDGMFGDGYILVLNLSVKQILRGQPYWNESNYVLYFSRQHVDGSSPYYSMDLVFQRRNNAASDPSEIFLPEVCLPYNYKKVWDFPEVWRQYP